MLYAVGWVLLPKRLRCIELLFVGFGMDFLERVGRCGSNKLKVKNARLLKNLAFFILWLLLIYQIVPI